MRTNSVSPGAQFLVDQEAVVTRLTEKYSLDRKIERDKLSEPIIWAKNPHDAKMLVKSFMIDSNLKMDFLSDLLAYDNLDGEDGEKRFVLVYQLYSIDNHTRIRIKCLIDEKENAETITDLFLGANWLEREIFDLFGISFNNHPNLRRIYMDERFVGYPLRKEFNIKHRMPFNDNIEFNLGANPLHVDTRTTPEGEK